MSLEAEVIAAVEAEVAAKFKGLVQSEVQSALNYAGQHLKEGETKTIALELLNKVKDLLA